MSDWKQRSHDWQAQRKREQRERETARKEANEKRYQQNLILKQHGYTWKKLQDIGGPSDDGDRADMVWTLFAPDGRVVTVGQALREIAEPATPPTAPAPVADPDVLESNLLAAYAEYHRLMAYPTTLIDGSPDPKVSAAKSDLLTAKLDVAANHPDWSAEKLQAYYDQISREARA